MIFQTSISSIQQLSHGSRYFEVKNLQLIESQTRCLEKNATQIFFPLTMKSETTSTEKRQREMKSLIFSIDDSCFYPLLARS